MYRTPAQERELMGRLAAAEKVLRFIAEGDAPDYSMQNAAKAALSSVPTAEPTPTCAHVFEEVTDGEAYIDTCIKCGSSGSAGAPTDE